MDTFSIVFLTTGLTIIVLSLFPLLWFFAPSNKPSQSLLCYTDEDGVSTDISRKTLLHNWSYRGIVGFSLVGLVIKFTEIILAAIHGSDGRTWILLWSQIASWALAFLQSVVVSTEKSATRRFNFANCAFWTSLGLAILGALDRVLDQHAPIFTLSIAVVGIAGLRGLCSVLIPRRPDVYHEGKVVDRERTVSLWSRLTFGYVTDFVRFAGEHQGVMRIDHFPQLPFLARSEVLHDLLYNEQQNGRTLFGTLCQTHIRSLILQGALAIGYAVSSFGPQIALYGILRALEDDSIGSSGTWIAALGVTMLVSSSLNSWVWCITYSKLAIPLYSELLALLYAKSVRRKIIHQADKAADDKEASKLPLEQKQQEAINLVTIDTKRISDYISYNHLIPSSVTQFIIGCGLLWSLIGWQALLAGLASNIITAPGNLFIAKQYSVFQVGLMQARDERTAIVYEVIRNIRQVKFSSIEPAWKQRVLKARQREMNLNFKACLYETGFKAIWTLAPLLLSAISLTVYALQNGRLEASVAFTSIAIFGSLEVALSALPHLISTALEAKISIDRIGKYMEGSEKAQFQSSTADSIMFQDATIAWPVREGREDVGFQLSELSFKFPVNGFSVLTGRTGSGKSLLLSSILGECDVLSGLVQVPHFQAGGFEQPSPSPSKEDWIIDSALAYVAQSPWTENGTIKDNILFGLPLDRSRYQKVLFASGLERDLEVFTDGDRTDIGANGINLSGGQRTRVSFARALYSRAGILILDDIFSALDADTSRHVYEHGLTGDLAQNRTRILATHVVGLCLPRTDYCVVLADGLATHAGSVEELRKVNALVEYELRGEEMDSARSQSVEKDAQETNDNAQEVPKFSPEEQRAIGSVPLRLYMKFLTGDKSAWLWTLGLLTSLLYTIFFFGRSWWLNIWTEKDQQNLNFFHPIFTINSAILRVQRVKAPEDLAIYVGVYVGLSFAASLFGTLRFLFIRFASLRSSQALFKNLLSAVLAAPLRWIDTVPLGRVLNRFTADIYTLDWLLGPDLADLLMWALQAIGVLAASVTVSPMVLVPAALLLAASLKLAAVYLSAAREVKRLESVSRTPVLEHFTSTLAGLTTIRAYDQTRKYTHLMFSRIDGYARVSWNLWLLNWWLQMRINFLGAIFSVIVAILVIKLGVSASLAGFAISFLLQYSTAVSSMIRFYASFEMDMNATERVIDYAEIETEPHGGINPPAGWPTRGLLEVENLTVGYSPELTPVLKGLTFTVESNQRVGIVGRTGSGKSTLALALFRFLEARNGQVFLDGLDTAKVNLHALRRGMAIVPQLPTLFKGTIRSNLDPFDCYSETEMNDALERVRFVSSNRGTSNPFTLETVVSEGGANFSQGQRQLLCLARAILQRTQIMILDEATSSVDLETDGHIQEAIRSEFGRNMSSLIVIAHRLSTIADFDRILVMSDGEIVENGSPKELINIEDGVFKELISQSNEKGLVEHIIMGQ